MANIDSAFSIDGLAIGELVLITAGTLDPAASGYEAPVGSLYLSTSGSIYRKSAATDTDWSLIQSGGASNHNDLLSIQGGTSNEYYHFTNTQHTDLLNHLSVTNNPHSTNLTNLADTIIATPLNRQFLIYETASSKWKNLVPATSDLTISTNRNFVTDAQLVVIGNTSGTNTGDQTITLTGDVTGSGTGSFSTTLATTALANKTFTGPITFNGQINVNDGNILNFNNTPGTDTIITVNALNISANELSFLDGVTSNIQTQLNAKGTGSVTTVSVTTANGVSGTVSTATTTPAISLSLGAITPTSVNSVVLSGSATPTLTVTGTSSISGSHSGSHSGTSSNVNTGDQTISDATITTTDISTNNVSITKHGFAPKAPNVATQYLNGVGAYSVPQLSEIGTVTLTSPVVDHALVYNGTAWVNKLISVPPSGSGRLVQIKFNVIPGATGSTTFAGIGTLPTVAEGTQIWTNTITPTNTTSKIRISSSIYITTSNSSTAVMAAIFRGSVCVGATQLQGTSGGGPMSFVFYDDPVTTSTLTYTCRVGRSAGATWYVNRSAGATGLSWLQANSYTLEEIGI